MTVFDDWCARLSLTLLPRLGRREVGRDGQGNVYMETTRGRPRRWVVFAKEVEASAVPPRWHGWLHWQSDAPPHNADDPGRAWYRPHRPNRTGTSEAYYPPGHLMSGGKRAPATGDYEAWTPATASKDAPNT